MVFVEKWSLVTDSNVFIFDTHQLLSVEMVSIDRWSLFTGDL